LIKEFEMSESIRVIPAILTNDQDALEKMLLQAEKYTDYVQIDIMDGKFVPSKSITWEDMAAIRTGINWEVHLMVEKPETQLVFFQKAGAKKAIFHFEACAKPEKVISTARKLKLPLGMAVNPETPVSKILDLTDQLDSILFLSVHPGFYGAKFIPEVLDNIIELRRVKPALKIGIDGGVKETNIAKIAKSGVNEICVGSAILLQPDPGAAYHRLLDLAQRSVHGESETQIENKAR
jgi:ribulose-phosphate 3-epimerase